MVDMNIIDDFSILLLEESRTLQALFDNWLPNVTTLRAGSPADIPTVYDSNVAVACLSESALGENSETTRKYILKRNPYCQLVAIVSRSSFVSIYENDYDACLQRPILKDQFQQTIEKRLVWGVYSTLLREFYDLNAKFHWIGRSDTPDELPESEDLEQYRERHSELCSQLDTLQSNLSMDNIQDISRSIQLHKRYLTTPTPDLENGVASKYHPSRCPECKLPWGVDHGNELDKGMVSIGAGVWKCKQCSEIVHGLGESGRRIMRG